MTKRLVLTNGKPTVVDDTSSFLVVKNGPPMIIDVVEFVDLGPCMCCGHHEYLGVNGNIVTFYCTLPISGTACEYIKSCPGVTVCPKKESFDPARQTTVMTLFTTIVDMLLEFTDRILMMDHNITREFVASRINDEKYLIGTVLLEQDDGKTIFRTIGVNEMILKHRETIGKNGSESDT